METAPFLNGKGLFAPYAPLCSYCPGLVALDNPQRHPASVEHRPEGACLQQRPFFWGPPQTEACDSANTQRRSVRQIAARMGMFLRHCEVVISPKRGTCSPVSSSVSVRSLLTDEAFSHSEMRTKFSQLLACCSHTLLSARYSAGKMVFVMSVRTSGIELCLHRVCSESKTLLAIRRK